MSQNGRYFNCATTGRIIAILGIFFATISLFVIITDQMSR